MENISKINENTFMKKQTDISQEYNDELRQAILKANIKRERFLAGTLIAICFVLWYLNTMKLKPNGNKVIIFGEFSYLHVLLILVSSVFLLATYTIKEDNRESISLLKFLNILISGSVLTLCALISVNNELINKQPFAFIIAIFCIASLVFLTLKERVFVYIVPYLTYVIGIYFVQNNYLHLFEDVFFATLLIIMAFVISNINFSSYVRSFIDSRIILEKNKEIKNMNKVTEDLLKKRTEELNETKEYEKLRTAFFANISHELRTPLNVIFSAEQMMDFKLKDTDSQERQKEIKPYMTMIKQNCYRLMRLISNLIDITKIDAGYFQVNLTNNDIVKIVEDITLSVAKYVEDKNINLTFDTEIEEIVVACDPDKIERIVLNLLSNAIKFSDKGGHIYVNIYERGDRVLISVKDTGIGIPVEMKDLIFEKFVQVDKTISRNREGSGIGLSLVKGLVEMHNGSISLISEQGKGSEFIIEIPKSTVCNTYISGEQNLIGENRNVEKINIEFSDIYS